MLEHTGWVLTDVWRAFTGIRQFHFNAWKDPNGTLAANPAGLKLAGITNETLDPKYTYFGEPASPSPK